MKYLLNRYLWPGKNLATRIDNDLRKETKKIAIDHERPFNNVIEEALRNLLRKYGEKSDQPGHFTRRK